jgi:hypothetical protein
MDLASEDMHGQYKFLSKFLIYLMGSVGDPDQDSQDPDVLGPPGSESGSIKN